MKIVRRKIMDILSTKTCEQDGTEKSHIARNIRKIVNVLVREEKVIEMFMKNRTAVIVLMVNINYCQQEKLFVRIDQTKAQTFYYTSSTCQTWHICICCSEVSALRSLGTPSIICTILNSLSTSLSFPSVAVQLTVRVFVPVEGFLISS